MGRVSSMVAFGVALVAASLAVSSHMGRSAAATAPSASPARAVAAEPVADAFAEAPEAQELEVVLDGRRTLRLPLESVFVLPGESVEMEVSGAARSDIEIEVSDGSLTRDGPARWSWIPPENDGHADLTLSAPGAASITLRAWTLVPRTEIANGRIGGFRVGQYPATPLRGNPIYLPPAGLVRVTEANRDVRVSPHFTIGHFISKQSSDLPSYLILRPQLLLKLELLLEALVDRGYPIGSFHVMSGYRTPYYNVQVLGNVQYSRHQWGGAADIFVDERPRNGFMDDLDGDGEVGLSDIAVITEVVDSLERELDGFPIGGAGVYRANAVRGPFVHIDVRGVPARW